MFTTFYHSVIRTIASAMMFLMCVISVGNTGSTNAYYSDTETSSNNIWEAGELDFMLDAPIVNYGGLTPNNESSAFAVTISTTTDSLPFAYNVRTGTTTGLLCEVLTLSANLEGIPLANAPLTSLFIATTTFPLQGDQWQFIASLGDAGSEYSGTSCIFDLLYRGWQEEYAEGKAYHDDEFVSLTITAGSWEDEGEQGDTIVDISAIQDSDVSEQKPNDTNGTANTLDIVRQNGKDSQAYISFAYTLPAGSVVEEASLKAYLFTTPTANTNYQASRVLTPWVENAITWNTKPASVPSDTISTGDTSAKWLSWDVTDDVQGYVDGSLDNYGWMIADIDPLPAGSRSGQLRSSEQESQEDPRPVLEVVFDAPVAPTDHVVINEVFYDVDSTHGSDTNNEWIELYNPTADPVSIQNWDICDGNSCDTIVDAVIIPAYGFAVIVNDASTYEDFWDDIPAEAVKIALNNALGSGLNDGGDRVILKDASDIVIDHMSYGSDTSSFNPSVAITGADGKSIARVVKGWDTDTVEDWIFNATPNPGTNPGSDEIEILRFTDAGVEVASITDGLDDLPELSASEIAELIAEEAVIEPPVVLVPLVLEEESKPEPFFGFEEDEEDSEDDSDPEVTEDEEITEVTEEIPAQETGTDSNIEAEEVSVEEGKPEDAPVLEEVVTDEAIAEEPKEPEQEATPEEVTQEVI